MISLLLPSRGRPDSLLRLAESAVSHANDPTDIELVVYIDEDDTSYDGKEFPSQVKIYSTQRTLLSKYWNLAYEKATGPIYMHCGDDIVMQTFGWDTKVKEAFNKYPDKIVLVYGDDGDPNKDKNFGTHSFLHQQWIEALGYFVPPYFSSDFNDTWLNELADAIGRKVKIDILTEHMHFAFRKGELDLTHAERLVRHWKDNTPAIYEAKADERLADIKKLKKRLIK